jgi:putative AdoMet-dependent methyltransferase
MRPLHGIRSGAPAAGLRPSGMERPDWHYDDLKQVGTDFAGAREVATYDENGDLAEDRALLEKLALKALDTFADIGRGTGLLAANITTQHAGFLSFALPDASLDLTTTKFALHHLSDQWKGVALDRMTRALKPGAMLFIRDVVFSCTSSELPRTAEAWITWMLENTGYDRAMVACHLRDEHSTYGWIMEGLIRQAGFDLLSTEYSNGVCADYIAMKPRAQ